MLRHGNRIFLYTAELVEGYRVHVSLCAIIDLKTIPRLLRPPFVSPRPVAPLAVSSTLFPVVLAPAIYSYRRHIRSIISKGVSTRLGEPRNRRRRRRRRRMEDGGEGCFAGGKIFLTAFASPPTSDFSHSSLRSLPPFQGGGRSPPMLALFLTLFHSEKLSSLSRARSLRHRYVCARVYAAPRSVRVRGGVRVCVCTCVRVCMCERRKNNGTELASNR